MSPPASPSRRKTLIFAIGLGLIASGALSLSLYKTAVANAYLTLSLPEGERAWPQSPAVTPALVERGHAVATLVGCADCHGENMGGHDLIDEPGYATLMAPNLTQGAGGLGRKLDDDAWWRAVQTGLDGENRVTWLMPRTALLQLAEPDVWAVVAYLKQLPAIDRTNKQNNLAWRGYIDVTLRRLRLLDRTSVPRVPPKVALPAVGLDNAATSFGARPIERAQWRAVAPYPDNADDGDYLRAVGRCGECHGKQTPLFGRVAAPPLPKAGGDLARCRVGARLQTLPADMQRALLRLPR